MDNRSENYRKKLRELSDSELLDISEPYHKLYNFNKRGFFKEIGKIWKSMLEDWIHDPIETYLLAGVKRSFENGFSQREFKNLPDIFMICGDGIDLSEILDIGKFVESIPVAIDAFHTEAFLRHLDNKLQIDRFQLIYDELKNRRHLHPRYGRISHHIDIESGDDIKIVGKSEAFNSYVIGCLDYINPRKEIFEKSWFFGRNDVVDIDYALFMDDDIIRIAHYIRFQETKCNDHSGIIYDITNRLFTPDEYDNDIYYNHDSYFTCDGREFNGFDQCIDSDYYYDSDDDEPCCHKKFVHESVPVDAFSFNMGFSIHSTECPCDDSSIRIN